MNCDEARHLLSLDVLPGAGDPVRTVLGFHLSNCPTCRAYRTQLHNQQLLQTLFMQGPTVPVPAKARHARFSNSATNGLRVASMALLLGGALALNPLTHGMTAQAAETKVVASTTYASYRAANASRIGHRVSSNAPRASLARASQSRVARAAVSASVPAAAAAVSAPAPAAPAASAAVVVSAPASPAYVTVSAPAPAAAAVNAPAPAAPAAVAEGMQAAPLQAGVELLIPALPQSPEEIAAAPAGQYIALATYIVQPGDTLSGIALRYYGNAGLWNAIYNANQWLGSSYWIYPGQALTIPSAPAPYTPPQAWVPAGPSLPRSYASPGIYIVQSGDTLSDIAQWAYGNGNLWPTIHQRNLGLIGSNYNLIFPGQSLTIPQLPQTGQGLTNPSPVQPGATVPTGYYRVQSGDNLSSIAQRVYGNANLWTVIYHSNQGTIGGNPDLIFPGQQFTIPAVS